VTIAWIVGAGLLAVILLSAALQNFARSQAPPPPPAISATQAAAPRTAQTLAPTQKRPPVRVAAPKPSPPPVVKWRTVLKADGVGNKRTPTFLITADEWAVAWDTGPGAHGLGAFAIWIHPVDGGMQKLAANLIGANRDITHERGDGRYYLEIDATQPYAVVVQEYR
jgi:hypothetical protein